MKRINHTGIALRNISHAVYFTHDDKARWFKVNWIIVSTSHAIFNTRGLRGHRVRQNIRHKLWSIAQRRHPVLNRYRIPVEIKGDSRCKIKLYYRILDLFSFFRMR
jgi:hypothetical protein